MFDSSLIESANLQRRKGGWITTLVSFVLHGLLVGGIVAAGIYANQHRVIERPIEAFVVSSAPPPPPPPPGGGGARAKPVEVEVPKTPQHKFVAPTETPQNVPDVKVDENVAGDKEHGVVGGVEGGVVGGVVGGVIGGVLGGQLGGTGDRALRVGGDVTPPEVIDRFEPAYPESARRGRIQGSVILEAIIDRNGSVTDVRVLKSLSTDLDEEAMKAVRQWKFRPGTRNGQPVPVIFNVNVNFRMQ